tara:strand:- start:72 stop:380 length:309 start_codon:yes stop_codon:yes gene_type:complete
MYIVLHFKKGNQMETITVFGLMMVAFFNSSEACQKWTDDTYSKEFGYACFELDGFYGQFYTDEYPTIKECTQASEFYYGKNECFKKFYQVMKPPLPRPETLS